MTTATAGFGGYVININIFYDSNLPTGPFVQLLSTGNVSQQVDQLSNNQQPDRANLGWKNAVDFLNVTIHCLPTDSLAVCFLSLLRFLQKMYEFHGVITTDKGPYSFRLHEVMYRGITIPNDESLKRSLESYGMQKGDFMTVFIERVKETSSCSVS